MIYNKFPLSIIFSFICTLLVQWSCVDHEYDAPPDKSYELDFPYNSSIAQLKTYFVAGSFVTIPVELNIHAVVVADDRSGNFYKTIVIQDSTGGIELKLNRTGLYTDYPVGMKIGLKCKGLTIGDYNGLIQLGLGTYQDNGFTNLAGIEDALIDQYVFKGPKNHHVVPVIKTINTLTAQDISTLIQLDRMEFDAAERNKTYADVIGQRSSNLMLTDCNNNSILLRSSNFADFAGVKVPSGNGTIVGILGKYRTDVQFFIRDTHDIAFYGINCNGGPIPLKQKSISEIRKLYTGNTLNLPDSIMIIGTVISDKDQSNITSKNVVIQDSTAGIVIRFLSSNTFSLGDRIEVNVSKQELSEFQGLLQLNNVDISKSQKIGNQLWSPAKRSISDILANFEFLESTLVEISDVTLSKSNGTTFSGTCLLQDATGSMDLFTQSYAAFSSNNIPQGPVKLVGFVNQGGTSQAKQISIRNLNDIVGGGTTSPERITILDLRHSFQGSTTTVQGSKKIKGIVISDRSLENTTLRNVHLQDSSGGIVVRFTANHSYNLNDEIEVDISGQEFTEFQGLLEINNVPLDKAKKTGTGNIVPKKFTLAEVLSNFEDLESTLVMVENVQISKSTDKTYSGTCVLTDASGQMELYTRPAALFSGQEFPVGVVRITAIVNQGGTSLARQLSLRATSDVTP